MTGIMYKDIYRDDLLSYNLNKKKYCKDEDPFSLMRQTDTTDSSVLRLKQCTQMLGYKEGQVIEEALIHGGICIFGKPKFLIVGKESA